MTRAIELGYSYRSHDFDGYDGLGNQIGLQCAAWQTGMHDICCDVLDIPLSEKADLILCTEVLEHVPDPVRVFEHLCRLLMPDGKLVVTVPFLSLMHQAPFWFQSGLSPYWFEFWARRCRLEIDELRVSGDYVDLLNQELHRSFGFLTRFEQKLMGRITGRFTRRLAKRAPRDLLEAGGFGTLFIGRMSRSA